MIKLMIYHGEHGNPNQWGKRNWPSEELIRSDIDKGCSYVCENDHGDVVGTFFFDQGKDNDPRLAFEKMS